MIHNAKIINNKPCCSKCGNDKLSAIRDYKSVDMGGNTYAMFQVKCWKCNSDLRYLADVYMDNTKRYEVSGNIKIIE